MNNRLTILLCAIFAISTVFKIKANTNPIKKTSEEEVGNNGFRFNTLDAGINTEYSEYGSGFFRNKFIMVSAKKIGLFAKEDKNTNEGFKNLFCVNIEHDGSLSTPLLFSHFINTLGNEDQISFTPDENTMYFTRSTEDDSSVYELYKASLEENSNGKWIGIEKLAINTGGSIENPFVSPDGKQLYFSSNRKGGSGGYDIYVSDILEDGTLSNPINLGEDVNTDLDDKFPSFSKDGSYLYFASQGHNSIGGFDLFRTKITDDKFNNPIVNLGNTLNTKYDEVAIFFASNTKGYLASNKAFGKGRYDIYKFEFEEIIQTLQGRVLDEVTKMPLPNATLILKDANGNEVDRVVTNDKAQYKFEIRPFDNYKVELVKDGFNPKDITFKSDKDGDRVYNQNLYLEPTKAEIVEEKTNLVIKVENIYFDFNKWDVSKVSTLTLNKVYDVLVENPEMTIVINAHTDQSGRASYNMALSHKRAKAARTYLINKGIAKDRMTSKGFGETQPLIDCGSKCTELQAEQNRRIEFVINR